MKRVPSVLTVAGSDSSGGAGIQADLKTITALGLYGSSAITAVTAQNTTGVKKIEYLRPELLAAQLDAVFTDIFPDAVKIGMAGSAASIRVIADKLRLYRPGCVVLDPVMISTSGRRLLEPDAVEVMIRELFPLVSLITPNLPEAEFLLLPDGLPPKSPLPDDPLPAGALSAGTFPTAPPASASDMGSIRRFMEKTALCLSRNFGVSVLLKGGHSGGAADDLICHRGTLTWFEGERLANPNSHGTGCTLSSAVACGLARGCSMEESVRLAKRYLTGALAYGLDLGSGSGPLFHGWNLPGA